MGVREVDDCAVGCVGEFPAFPLNLVVLTNRSDAPQRPTTEVTSCASTDTGWPCAEPNSLTEYFVTELGDPVCSDPSDPATCVRFELGAQAYRADLDASSAATDCADALSLADSLYDGSGNPVAPGDWDDA